MSEYTMYAVAHIEDIELFRKKLEEEKISAVIKVDENHPCFDKPSEIDKEWLNLTYQQRWAIVVSDQLISQLPLINIWGGIIIQEDRERWLLRLVDKEQKIELLFSDHPWGDYSDENPTRDEERIKHANEITTEDLEFMEKCFQIPRNDFQKFLKIGNNNAIGFMKVIGWPAIDMFDTGRFAYEPVAELTHGKVMLWDEFEEVMD